MRALLGDIGGTNARFALREAGRSSPVIVLPVAGFPTAEAALTEALRLLKPGGEVTRTVLAVAGPVVEGRARLTNGDWVFDPADLDARLGLGEVRVVNDFIALAHALPALEAADLAPIGGGSPVKGAPLLVLGPGTGLGAAGYVPGAGAVATEGGHITLAPSTAEQAAVLTRIGPRVSAEEVLSGPGLERLHAAMTGERLEAEAIVAAAGGGEAKARAAVAMFLDLLAGYAGDMALAWGARGGVFLGGGVLSHLAPFIDTVAFRARFEAKPPMQPYLANIPLARITHPAPAFVGLAGLAQSEVQF